MGKEGYSLHFYPDDERLDAVPASFCRKEKSVSRHHYVLLPCILLFFFAGPCLATDQRQGERVLCGDYSYILPEGFNALDMPQPCKDKIYLNRRDYDVTPKSRNYVICIQTENNDNRDFVLDSVQILHSSKRVKHDYTFELKQYKKIIKDDRLVYYYNPDSAHNGLASWLSLFVEINAHNSAMHTILYFSTDFRRDVKKGRNTISVEMSDEDRKKIALKFIDSIQKVR